MVIDLDFDLWILISAVWFQEVTLFEINVVLLEALVATLL